MTRTAEQLGTASPAGGPGATGRRTLVIEFALLLGIFVIALAMRVGTMDQPLLEHHSFRQTQTAFQAREFHEHGIDLMHPKVPVLDSSFEIPYEFPLYQAIATLPMNLGVSTDQALRWTGLFFFFVTGSLLYGLLRRIEGRLVATIALIVFLFSPFGVVWSRTSMVEYLATAGALGFVWAGIAWRDSRHLVLAVVAVLAGVVAMLVKLTTGVFWMLPFILYVGRDELPGLANWVRTRLRPAVSVLVAIPLVAGWWWTRHADAIKAASPTTSWLTSSALTTWNFGTLSQRLHVHNWGVIANRVGGLVAGWILVPFLVILVWRARKGGFWLGWLLATVLPVVVFFNLYVVHDYYLAAVQPGVAGAVGLGVAFVLARVPRRAAFALGAALLVVFLAPVSWLRTDYVDAIYRKVSDPDHALPYATELRARTLPSDRVVVDGYDWNPAILYYAHRDGMMLAPSAVYPGLYRDLSRSGYNTWLAVNGGTGQFDQIGTWPWVGVESNHAYRLGHSAADVDRAHVVATNDAAALASSGAGQSTSSTAVLCNGKEFRVPAGAQGTWFVPTARSPAGLRISFDRSAPLPAFAAYVVRTGKPGAAISVTCSGPPSVSLRVKDAPVP